MVMIYIIDYLLHYNNYQYHDTQKDENNTIDKEENHGFDQFQSDATFSDAAIRILWGWYKFYTQHRGCTSYRRESCAFSYGCTIFVEIREMCVRMLRVFMERIWWMVKEGRRAKEEVPTNTTTASDVNAAGCIGITKKQHKGSFQRLLRHHHHRFEGTLISHVRSSRASCWCMGQRAKPSKWGFFPFLHFGWLYLLCQSSSLTTVVVGKFVNGIYNIQYLYFAWSNFRSNDLVTTTTIEAIVTIKNNNQPPFRLRVVRSTFVHFHTEVSPTAFVVRVGKLNISPQNEPRSKVTALQSPQNEQR